MRIGIGHYYIKKYGMTEGAKRMAEHGYTCLDFPLANTKSEYYGLKGEGDLERTFLGIKRELAAHGVSVHQIHGPWLPLKDVTDEDRAERFEKMTVAMVVARHLGAKYMAVHPLLPFGTGRDNPDEVININRNFYTAVANVGEKLGVYVCLENMPFPDFPLSTPEQITDFVKEINHRYLKVCLDIGHANLFPSPIGEHIRYIGKDLLAIIHAHDNYGECDSHNTPYDGTVDWADCMEALYDIGFDGVFNLEAEPASKTDSPEEAERAELELAKTAKLLAGY